MAYSIGLDYGTESGRVLLLDLKTGQELSSTVIPFSNGVITRTLPSDNNLLPPDWALQDPRDYIEVIVKGIPQVLQTSGVDANQVIGIGVAFTSCTVMPVTKDGVPLCEIPGWEARPHAWPKLWKHHAALRIADRINNLARQRGESFLDRYGGSISSEWYFPKLLEVFEEDRDVYESCDHFVEAGDWIVWYLSGNLMRSVSAAGFKAMWSETESLPSNTFFQSLNPDFLRPSEKLGTEFYGLGTKAGFLKKEIAHAVGLTDKVAISVANIDAHASVPGAGVYTEGTLVMAIGTSICHLTTTREEIRPQGITGVVKDGVLPGLYGYEAGQAAVGDMFAWFVKNCVNKEYEQEALQRGISTYGYLEELASNIEPGQSGLLALDWFNGNRSVLGDANLSGLIFGLNLSTTLEEMYRALLESVAFGTRQIIEVFRQKSIPVEAIVATGGIARRSKLLMQIYADVCQVPVLVPDSEQVVARGAALFGSAAAGRKSGGYSSIVEAAQELKPRTSHIYKPKSDYVEIYNSLYSKYSELYNLFGRERQNLAHELKTLRVQQTLSRTSQRDDDSC